MLCFACCGGLICANCCLLFSVVLLMFVVCCLRFVVGRLSLFVGCRLPFVAR